MIISGPFYVVYFFVIINKRPLLCCIFFCFVCNNCHIKNRIRVAQADVDIFI